jgi:putative tryptophan/tyrosine transport system substrate-binding protein
MMERDQAKVLRWVRSARRLLFELLLITLLAVGNSWVSEARAQEKRIPRVGVLAVTGAAQQTFERTLAARGWVPGKNVIIEHRVMRNDATGVAEMVQDLVRLNVDVIVAWGAPMVIAARAATSTIPIVSVDYTTDPVAAGYVQSYGRPGKNVTGAFLDAPEFAGKWIEMLKAIVPKLRRVGALWDPTSGKSHLTAVQRAAQSAGIKVEGQEVHAPDDIEKAFSAFHGRVQALIVLPSPIMYIHSERLAKLTLKHRLPAPSMARAFAEAGGIIAYGPDLDETMQRCGRFVARIHEGAQPGDLPIERPMRFEFVLNMKTVKAFGLKIPDTILLGSEHIDN